MNDPFNHYIPKKTSVVTVGTNIVTLKSLVTAFEAGVTRVWLQNLDPTSNIYWAYGTSAPSAKTDMAIITPMDVWPLDFRVKYLDRIYVTADGAGQKLMVHQDGVDR